MFLLSVWGPSSYLILGATALFIILIKEIIASRSQRNRLLAKIPGPNYPPFLYTILMGLEFFKDSFNLTTTSTRFLKESKGITQYWVINRPLVVISQPEHLKTFFTSPATIDRSTFYEATKPILGDSLILAQGDNWNYRRKMFLNNFVATPAENLLKNVLEVREEMLKMCKQMEGGDFFSVKLIMSKTTLKGIMGIAFNSKLKEEVEVEVIHQIHNAVSNVFPRATFFAAGIEKLLPYTARGKVFGDAILFLTKFFDDIVLKEKQIIQSLKAEGKPLQNIYMNKLIEGNGDNMKILTEETSLLMGAALDTTAHTMAYVLLVLGVLPDVQEKVYQEVMREQERQGEKEITVEDIKNYEYLHRVIKETLRLFPVTGLNGRYLMEDTYFGEYLVPARTEIIYNIVFTNYQEEYFYEPRKFIPDRFLPENKMKIPPYAFNPFNNGPRICPGRRYAMMAMTVFLSEVVKKYRITSQYKTLDDLIDNCVFEVMTFDKNDFKVNLQRRH